MDVQPKVTGAVADRTALRRTLGAFATGVTVVTVGGPSPHGMTANSFTAVSLDPPLVLVCVEHGAVMHEALSRTETFGISVLARHQERVARHFADRRRPLGREQFDFVDWLPGDATGVPLIAGALAHFECDLWRWYDGGDHTIFLGSVRSLDRRPGDDALLFLCGQFRQVEAERSDVPT